MIRETNIEFELALRYGRGGRSTKNTQAIRQLERELERPFRVIDKMYASGFFEDVEGLDEFSNKLSIELRRIYDRNFIENPPSWVPLSYPTRKVREYKMNPMKLKEDMLKAVRPQQSIIDEETGEEVAGGFRKLFGKGIHKGLFERSKYLEEVNIASEERISYDEAMERLDKFFRKIRPITPWKSIVQPGKPALLYSGKLKDSIKPKMVSRRKKSRFDAEYKRTIEFRIAGYGKPLIEGLTTQVAQLNIERISSKPGSSNVFSFDFYLPNEWVQKFLSLDLGSFYKVNVFWISVKVPKRDPFVLNDKDIKVINDMQMKYNVSLSNRATNQFKKMYFGSGEVNG